MSSLRSFFSGLSRLGQFPGSIMELRSKASIADKRMLDLEHTLSELKKDMSGILSRQEDLGLQIQNVIDQHLSLNHVVKVHQTEQIQNTLDAHLELNHVVRVEHEEKLSKMDEKFSAEYEKLLNLYLDLNHVARVELSNRLLNMENSHTNKWR